MLRSPSALAFSGVVTSESIGRENTEITISKKTKLACQS